MLLAWATWGYTGKCCYVVQQKTSERFCLQCYTKGLMAGKKNNKHTENSPIWEMGFSDKYRSCFQREDMVRGRPARLPWGNGACLCIHEVVNSRSETVLIPLYVSSLWCFLQVWCTTSALVLHLLLIRISRIQAFCKFWILLGLLR